MLIENGGNFSPIVYQIYMLYNVRQVNAYILHMLHTYIGTHLNIVIHIEDC